MTEGKRRDWLSWQTVTSIEPQVEAKDVVPRFHSPRSVLTFQHRATLWLSNRVVTNLYGRRGMSLCLSLSSPLLGI